MCDISSFWHSRGRPRPFRWFTIRFSVCHVMPRPAVHKLALALIAICQHLVPNAMYGCFFISVFVVELTRINHYLNFVGPGIYVLTFTSISSELEFTY